MSLPNAAVRVNERGKSTDAGGDVRLDSLPSGHYGHYAVSCSLDGYVDTLRAEGSDGHEIEAYRQLIAPVAGGVLITGA